MNFIGVKSHGPGLVEDLWWCQVGVQLGQAVVEFRCWRSECMCGGMEFLEISTWSYFGILGHVSDKFRCDQFRSPWHLIPSVRSKRLVLSCWLEIELWGNKLRCLVHHVSVVGIEHCHFVLICIYDIQVWYW